MIHKQQLFTFVYNGGIEEGVERVVSTGLFEESSMNRLLFEIPLKEWKSNDKNENIMDNENKMIRMSINKEIKKTRGNKEYGKRIRYKLWRNRFKCIK